MRSRNGASPAGLTRRRQTTAAATIPSQMLRPRPTERSYNAQRPGPGDIVFSRRARTSAKRSVLSARRPTLLVFVSIKEDGLSMAPAVGAFGPARGLVASGAHVSIAPSGSRGLGVIGVLVRRCMSVVSRQAARRARGGEGAGIRHRDAGTRPGLVDRRPGDIERAERLELQEISFDPTADRPTSMRPLAFLTERTAPPMSTRTPAVRGVARVGASTASP